MRRDMNYRLCLDSISQMEAEERLDRLARVDSPHWADALRSAPNVCISRSGASAAGELRRTASEAAEPQKARRTADRPAGSEQGDGAPPATRNGSARSRSRPARPSTLPAPKLADIGPASPHRVLVS